MARHDTDACSERLAVAPDAPPATMRGAARERRFTEENLRNMVDT